ncbi:MAG: T9SS type A sorting domain-containing protein [Ginsengibacter sp.]
MAKYLHIQVPERCEESWDVMQQKQHGKFCNSCQKTVIDFSKMSDEQLIRFFKKEKENVCGRFTTNQLDTDILIPPKKIHWLKYLLQVTIPVFLFSSKLIAQGVVKVQAHSQVAQTARKTSKNLQVSKSMKRFSGVQIDENMYAEKVSIKPEAYQIKENKCSSVESEPQLMSFRMGGITSGVRIQKKHIFKSSKVDVTKTFIIFPNPITSSSELNIKWSKPFAANQTIEIYNESGILVQKEILAMAKDDTQTRLNLKQLQPATYTIKISDSKTHKSSSQQFILL